MPAAPLPELAPLLLPVAADRPAGEDLRYDPLYDTLRELRRADDASLPQGVWKHDLKKADWRELAAEAGAALASRSKDLQLASWLAEAWTHLDGFAGAARGLTLLAELCDTFWNDLHPQPDGADLGPRLAPLNWADQHLALALALVPLTAPAGPDALPPADWQDRQRALYLARLAEKDQEAVAQAAAAGEVTEERFQKGVRLTPTPFYQEAAAALAAVAEAHARLRATLERQAGEQAASLSAVAELTADLTRFVGQILAERPAEAPAAEGEPEAAPPVLSPGEAAALGGPRSRAEAYRQLTAAAAFLRATEPHSPVPYLVERAVSWGALSLAELFAELLADKSDLKTLYQLLGIKVPAAR